MALILTAEQAAFLTAMDPDIQKAFLEGVSLPGGTPASLAALPKYNEIRAEVQQQIRDGMKMASVALLYRLFLFRPEVHTVSADQYLNGFAARNDFGYPNSRYTRTLDGEVIIEGLVTTPGSPNGKVIFNLPTGFRPDSNRIFAVVSNDAAAVVEVQSDGDVVCRVAANTNWLALDGIRFRAA